MEEHRTSCPLGASAKPDAVALFKLWHRAHFEGFSCARLQFGTAYYVRQTRALFALTCRNLLEALEPPAMDRQAVPKYLKCEPVLTFLTFLTLQ